MDELWEPSLKAVTVKKIWAKDFSNYKEKEAVTQVTRLHICGRNVDASWNESERCMRI